MRAANASMSYAGFKSVREPREVIPYIYIYIHTIYTYIYIHIYYIHTYILYIYIYIIRTDAPTILET